VGFDPTIPAFERAKTVHALDFAVTVIGPDVIRMIKSRKRCCARHVKHVEEAINEYTIKQK
jgi:hypothetical protein